ncbi:MAG TPA: aminoglycoside 6'-N-acetyltransferase [Lysobacter sp.]
MTAAWSIRQATAGDLAEWAALRQALWPDENPGRHAGDIHDILGKPGRAVGFLVIDRAGRALGFAEATLRTDYVNGTDSSPVGFLEGWYVVPEHRRSGAGRALVEAVERWTREQACTELASDTWLDNALGQQAHRACGFEEVERVVYFRKRLVA